MRIVDTHLHLWNPDVLTYAWLEGDLLRPFGDEELGEALQDAKIKDFSAVFVQAECLPAQSMTEVDWVGMLASRVPISGIVARAPLEDPARTADLLDAYRERPLVVGVRRVLQSEQAGFCSRPGFLSSARMVAAAGLSFDACIRWRQIQDVIALADAVPELTIILDHLGKPEIGYAGEKSLAKTQWAHALRRLAQRPNVLCKLSGLPAEAVSRTPGQFLPFLDVALDAFGPGRLMFGSDWPVSAPYVGWFDIVTSWLQDSVDDRDRELVLAGNAERHYRHA